jgi:hypothetical protein
MFPLWFALLGGSFVVLDVRPSILFLVFLFFGCFWLVYGWQGFIICIPFQVQEANMHKVFIASNTFIIYPKLNPSFSQKNIDDA